MVCEKIRHLFLKVDKRVGFYLAVDGLRFRRLLDGGQPASLPSRSLQMTRQKEVCEEHQAHATYTEEEVVHNTASLPSTLLMSLPT
jgi:hypothetical protein